MDLYTKLSTCMEELSSTFTSRMAQYEDNLRNASGDTATHKTIASLSREFAEFKTLIWKTMGALKSQMELLVTGLDRHEMASRTKVLLIHGLDEDTHTDHLPSVLKVLDKIQVHNISEKDITTCHRLGNNTGRPRPLLVRFESRRVRREVWQRKSLLKGSGLTLSEFLTKPRHDVFLSARKHFGVRRCWTVEGQIIIQVSDKLKHKIETAAELRLLIEKFPVAESESAPSKNKNLRKAK